MSNYTSNVSYTEFVDESNQPESPSMYLSIEEEERRPFIDSQERYLELA